MTIETEGSQGLPDGESVLEDPAVSDAMAKMEAEREEKPQGQEEPKAEDGASSEVDAQAEAEKAKKAEQSAIDKRFAELTREKYAEKRKREAAEAAIRDLEEKFKAIAKGETPAEDKPKSEEDRRKEIRAEAQRLRDLDRFNDECNRTAQNGEKEFEDFGEVRDDLVKSFGNVIQRRPDFLEAINDLPDGHKVFYHLGKNLDEADRILSMPPVKMALALSKLSEGNKKAATPAPKPISKVPAPVTPISGGARATEGFDDKVSMDDFAKNLLKEASQW